MTVSPTSQAFLDRFAAVHGDLPGADLPWLAKIRSDALKSFGALGIPNTRVEEWKYTSLRALDGLDLDAAGDSAGAVSEADLPALVGDGTRLVFVDGKYNDDLSAIAPVVEGLTITNLADHLTSDPGAIEARLADQGDNLPMLALNGAFAEDGFVIALEDGTKVETPVEILYWDSATGSAPVRQPRNIIIAGKDSQITLLETHAGAGASQQFFNGATLVTAETGARIKHYRIQAQAAGSVHVNTIRARVSADAEYESFVLAAGGSVARDEIHVGLTEANASAKLNGVYLGTGDQVIDNTTVIRHDAPDTVSEELYKGVLDGSARAVFQGNIRVEKGADGTDGRLSNRTILLSNDAEIDTKPQLEIYADDVQCAHGATAGELDDEALFYLRSRGINEDAARHMLIGAFLGEVVDNVEDETLSELLRTRVADWLKTAQISAEAAK